MSLPLSDLQGKGSRLRTPILNVFVNQNDILTGAESFEVTNASHFAADTFRLTAAISKLPQDLGIAYWGNSAGDELEIFAGFKGQGKPLSLIYGQVDEVEVNLVGQTLTLIWAGSVGTVHRQQDGRDFQDQTASKIVQTSRRDGGACKASVTPTTTRVGTYYELYHQRLTKDQSEWDLLMFLARAGEIRSLGIRPDAELPAAGAGQRPIPMFCSGLTRGRVSGQLISRDLKLHRSQTLAKISSSRC